MKINTIQNYNIQAFAAQNFGRGEKPHKETKNTPEEINNSRSSHKVPITKMMPMILAMAGMTTFNSCSDEYKEYKEYRDFKTSCFENLSGVQGAEAVEKALQISHIKVANYDMKSDTLTMENKDFVYKQNRSVQDDETLIFGYITRKSDGKQMKFINTIVEDKITNSILIDRKTDEKFFVDYDDGVIKTIKTNGKRVNDEQYAVFSALLIALSGFLVLADKIKGSRGAKSKVEDN